jgi:hypothetical protein
VGLKNFKEVDRMKRINKSVIELNNNKVLVTLYRTDETYNDEIEDIQISSLEGDSIEFAIGCFEVFIDTQDQTEQLKKIEKMIEKSEKNISELQESKWNEEEAILSEQEYLEYLKEERKKLTEAEDVDRIIIRYSKCKLEICFNEKTIEIDSDTNLIFKNLEIKIEKF